MELCTFTSVVVAAVATDVVHLHFWNNTHVEWIFSSEMNSCRIPIDPCCSTRAEILFFEEKNPSMHESSKFDPYRVKPCYQECCHVVKAIRFWNTRSNWSKQTKEQNHTVWMYTVIWAKRDRGERDRKRNTPFVTIEIWYFRQEFTISNAICSPARCSIWLMTSA